MRALIALLLSAGVVTGIGCSGSTASGDATPTAVAIATPTSITGCTPTEAQEAVATIEAFQPTVDEFNDAVDRARASGRIALSPVVADLQSVRREARDLELPACASPFQTHVVAYMDGVIDALLAFQGGSNDISSMIDTALESADRAYDDVADLRTDADN
jgi:hypothetical protein